MMNTAIPELHYDRAVPPLASESSGIRAEDLLEQAGDDKPGLNPDAYNNRFPYNRQNRNGRKGEDLSSEDKSRELENKFSLHEIRQSSMSCFLLHTPRSRSTEKANNGVPVSDFLAPTSSACHSWPRQSPVPKTSFVQENISYIEMPKTVGMPSLRDHEEEGDRKVLEMRNLQKSEISFLSLSANRGKEMSATTLCPAEEHQEHERILWPHTPDPSIQHSGNGQKRRFTRAVNLFRNPSTVHESTQLFKKCDRCGKIFLSKELLVNHLCLGEMEPERDAEVILQSRETEKKQAQGSKIDAEDLRQAETLKTSFTLAQNDVDGEEDLKFVEMLDLQTSEFSGTSHAANRAISDNADLVGPKAETQGAILAVRRMEPLKLKKIARPYKPDPVMQNSGKGQKGTFTRGVLFRNARTVRESTQLFKKCDRCGKIFISNSLLQSHICSESLEHESDGKVSFQPSETERKQAQGSKIDTEDLRQAETLKTSFTLSRNDLDEEDNQVVETLDFETSEFSGTSQAANGAIRGNAGLVNPKAEIRESSSVPERNMASLQKEFIHTEDNPHSCHLCGNSFTRARDLSRHVRTVHEGKKSFLCDVCGKGFGHSGHLTNHKRLHTKEKPFKCTHCNKRFRQSGSCKNHERTHTGDRPYQCQFCEKRFRVSSDCRGHERALHTKQNLHNCPTCDKRFLRPYSLKMHRKSCTDRRNPCIEDLRQAETQNTSFTLSQDDLDKEEDLKVVEILDSQPSEFSGTSHTANAAISDNAGSADPKAETQESAILNKSMDQLFKCDSKTFKSQEFLEQHRPCLHGFENGSDGARSSPTTTVERHTQEEMTDAEQIRHVKTVNECGKREDLTCDVCRKTFSCSSHLKRHMIVHTREKPHSCRLCEEM